MNKIKLYIFIILIGLIITLMTGCEKDERKCIESHEEVKPMYFYNGRSMSVIPVRKTICDKYEGE